MLICNRACYLSFDPHLHPDLGSYKKAEEAFEEAYTLEKNMTTYAGTYAGLLAQLDNEHALEKFCEHLSEDCQVESYISHCYLALMKV